MNSKLLITFMMALCASTTFAHNYLDLQPLVDQQNLLMRQMMQKMTIQRAANNIDIDNIAICFNWYTSIQNVITTTYNTKLNQCVSIATEEKKLLSEQSAERRSSLEGRGHSICTQLSNCELINDALDFFTCYKTAGSNNSQILYDISVGSEYILNNITTSYQHVDDEERICTTNARNSYVSSLSNSATNLNNCLIGAWVPSSPTDAPTSTTTETSETTKPAVTTEAVPTTKPQETTTISVETTKVPETTKEPETTEEPQTTEATEVADTTTESAWRVLPEEDVYRHMRSNRWRQKRFL